MVGLELSFSGSNAALSLPMWSSWAEISSFREADYTLGTPTLPTSAFRDNNPPKGSDRDSHSPGVPSQVAAIMGTACACRSMT